MENWIVLFTGCPSEEAFKESVQHHKVFYSSALRKALIFPQGCLVAVSTPEVTSGEFTSKELQLRFEDGFLSSRQNYEINCTHVEDNEECKWMNTVLMNPLIICQKSVKRDPTIFAKVVVVKANIDLEFTYAVYDCFVNMRLNEVLCGCAYIHFRSINWPPSKLKW